MNKNVTGELAFEEFEVPTTAQDVLKNKQSKEAKGKIPAPKPRMSDPRKAPTNPAGLAALQQMQSNTSGAKSPVAKPKTPGVTNASGTEIGNSGTALGGLKSIATQMKKQNTKASLDPKNVQVGGTANASVTEAPTPVPSTMTKPKLPPTNLRTPSSLPITSEVQSTSVPTVIPTPTRETLSPKKDEKPHSITPVDTMRHKKPDGSAEQRKKTKRFVNELAGEQFKKENIESVEEVLEDEKYACGSLSDKLVWIKNYGDNHNNQDRANEKHFTCLGAVFMVTEPLKVPQFHQIEPNMDIKGWKDGDWDWVEVEPNKPFLMSCEECYILMASSYKFNLTCCSSNDGIKGNIAQGEICTFTLRWAEYIKDNNPSAKRSGKQGRCIPKLYFNVNTANGLTAKASMEGIYVSDDKNDKTLKPMYRDKYSYYADSKTGRKQNPNSNDTLENKKAKQNIINTSAMKRVLELMAQDKAATARL